MRVSEREKGREDMRLRDSRIREFLKNTKLIGKLRGKENALLTCCNWNSISGTRVRICVINFDLIFRTDCMIRLACLILNHFDWKMLRNYEITKRIEENCTK